MKNNFVKVILLPAVMVFAAVLIFSGCNPKDTETVTVNVASPDGAPTLALAGMIASDPVFENLNGTVDYSVVMSDATTEAAVIIGNKLVSGDYDMAILPTNTAAALYNKGADIKLLTVNTWGNLYIVSEEAAVTDITQLKGEVIYVISQSGPPMAVLKYLFEQNGIAIASDEEYTLDENGFAEPVADKVVIKYMPATAVIPNLKQKKIKYGLLGEPAVTNAINVIGGDAKIVLDLQTEWAKLTGSDSYPQAALVARSEFINNHKAFVDEFVTDLAAQKSWIEDADNLETIKAAITAKASATALANITSDTVSRCGIDAVGAADTKTAVTAYLALFGITVADGFYYEG